jgi:hypothetical protein
MPIPEIPEPRIALLFDGIVAVNIADKQRRVAAGIIKGVNSNAEVTAHKHSIEIRKLKNGQEAPPDGSFPKIFNLQNPARVLQLNIGNGAATGSKPRAKKGLRLFRPSITTSSFDRQDAFSNFNWVIDVEKEMHGAKVKLNNKALRSVLRVDGIEQGTFFIESICEGPIFTEDEQSQQQQLLGGAKSVKALLPLPASGAKLMKLDDQSNQLVEVCTLKSEAGVTYEVSVKNLCIGGPGACPGVDVTGFYNDLVAGAMTGKRRVRFIPRPPLQPAMATTPETQCTIINFSMTEELPDPAP